MKNFLIEHPMDGGIIFTNDKLASGLAGTAVDLAPGAVIKRGNLFYIVNASLAGGSVNSGKVAANAQGTAEAFGRFTLAKSTGAGTALKQGQSVGWDFTNSVVTTDLSGGVIGCVAEDAATTDATVSVNLNVHSRRQFVKVKNPSSAEDTANSMDVDCGFPVAGAAIFVTLRNSSGLQRVCTTVRKSGTGNENIITISEASLAATDEVTIHVIENAAATA